MKYYHCYSGITFERLFQINGDKLFQKYLQIVIKSK